MKSLLRLHQFAAEIRRQLSNQPRRTSSEAYAQMDSEPLSRTESSTDLNGVPYTNGLTLAR